MAQTPPRPAEEKETDPREPTPLERMTELTRRVLRVPKDEVVKAKQPTRRRHPNTPDA